MDLVLKRVSGFAPRCYPTAWDTVWITPPIGVEFVDKRA